MSAIAPSAPDATWPALPALADWGDTCTTLQLWTQMVGKTLLALAPPQNHWWHCTLRVSARGLVAPPVTAGTRELSIEFDFIDHALRLRTSDGQARQIALEPQTVARFYAQYLEALEALQVHAPHYARPVEMEPAIPFAEDHTHAAYDREAVHAWWRALVQVDRVFKRYREGYAGKQSPSHFFWGAFDLAVTRFSGREAPRHPGGAPNCADWVMVEAYSHECSSAGFWPGSGPVETAAFYAYAYPEPEGYTAWPVQPAAASYHLQMREFVLPYEAVRTAPDPEDALMQFLQTTYAAAAVCGRWEQAAGA